MQTPANIGDSSGLQPSAAAGNLYVALFTTATTVNDSSAGTECAYTGYARVAVVRSATGWNVTIGLGQASNAAPITFPPCSAGAETVAYFAIYTALTGGDRILWGQLNVALPVVVGVTPEFSTGALAFIED